MASSTSTATAAPRLPDHIGRFRPIRVLGRGGQCVVYLAEDPELGREVAVKCLSHRARDPARLLNEARNVARLDHPGIVALFEIELQHMPPYLVYQFAPGVPLSALRDGGNPLPPRRVVDIMIKSLDALGCAHQQGILHRDLTPANILVDDEDNPRILDFGISVALSDSTGATTLNGTVNYLAPEILAEKPPGPGADIFALGVLMHELLTGRPLFQAENPMAVIYKILNERILPPSMTRAGIDSALEQIVMKALEKDPAQRFQSAAAMRDALRDYLAPATAETASEGVTDARGAVAFLVRRMARKPDFPAVSQHIAEINQKSGLRDRSDANELASVILKDYALTTKLLKIVNSAVYGQYGGSISTVSRAVVILGFEQVRAIALGIIIFEHLRNGEQAGLLKEAACSSFLSGMLARELCPPKEAFSSEEAFIAALFHRLGRHLAIYYFPDEFREVLELVASRGIDEERAAREIFGATFYDFGSAIARDWNLPERLLQAMRPQPAGKLKQVRSPEGRISQLSAFSNEVAALLGTREATADTEIDALIERYKECIAIGTSALKSAVRKALDATREYASIINIDLESTPFLGKVARAVATDSPARDAGEAHQQATQASTTDEPVGEDIDVPARDNPAAGSTHERQVFLTNAIADLTNAILEKAPINDMLAMVMEAFYRGLGFSHVLFLMRDAKTRNYRARSGFGDALPVLQERFVYTPDDSDNIFSQATRRARNAVIIDANDERYAGTIPAWCRELTAPRSILLFAVVVNKVCIGLIYADTSSETLRINAQELKLLNTLVKQLTLGVNQR